MAEFLAFSWRTVSVISFILLMTSHILFVTFSIIETQGRDKVIFDTGIYLGIFYIAVIGALTIIFMLSHWLYNLGLSKTVQTQKILAYPPYVRDIYGWLRPQTWSWIILTVIIIFLVVNFGFKDVDADYTEPFGSKHLVRFTSTHFFVIVFSYASFIYGFDVAYAYILKIYKLSPHDLHF